MDDERNDQLIIDQTMDGDAAVLRLTGDVDIDSRDVIIDLARDAVASGASRLVLDVSGVTFMDSSGIAAIIEVRALAPLVLRKPSMIVQRLMAITGLSETIEVEP